LRAATIDAVLAQMTINGLDDALQAQSKLRRGVVRACAHAAYAASESILDRAISRAPYREGTLRRSRFMTEPRVTAYGFAFAIGFGAMHARWTHERVDRTYRQGGPRYLARAVEEGISEYERRVADVYSRALAELVAHKRVRSSLPSVAHPTAPDPSTLGRRKTPRGAGGSNSARSRRRR
jgi:hypothetical protein